MNEYADSDTDAVIEGPVKSYIPGLAVVTGGDPSTGAYQYQLRDRLGSVRDIRSQAKARLAEYTFEPYGDVWSASGLALNQGFTGHTWDAALGMYHTAFRHYSPGMARWMSRDPLGMVDGPNLYGYVGGDPVNGVDLLGLWGSDGHGECYSSFDETHPPLNPIYTSQHFEDLGPVQLDLDEAIKRRDILGFYDLMHQMQDYYSHYRKGYRAPLGHALDGHAPDIIANNLKDYYDMARNTRRWERMWETANGPLPCTFDDGLRHEWPYGGVGSMPEDDRIYVF